MRFLTLLRSLPDLTLVERDPNLSVVYLSEGRTPAATALHRARPLSTLWPR